MKSSTTNEVLIEDNGQPVLHKSVMTPNDELYLKVNNDKLQFKHQMSDAFVDLSTTLDLPEIVQVTGTFTDKVMSQNAVTNALNTKANADSVVNKTDIVQSTGSSETKVMSQKAVTNMLAQKASQSSLLNLANSVGTIKNTTIPELRKVVDDNKLEVDRTTADLTEKINTINDTTIPAINKTITDNVSRIDGDIGTLGTTKANVSDVINKTDIVHQPGTANDKVMSQNTTTYNLNLKVDKTAIVQATGNATDKIMSQDAVTKALAAVGTDIQVVQTTGSSQTSVMSQDAVTNALNEKQSKGDYALKTEIPSIKVNNIAQTTLSFTSDPQTQIDGKTTVNIGGVAQSQVNFTTDPQTQIDKLSNNYLRETDLNTIKDKRAQYDCIRCTNSPVSNGLGTLTVSLASGEYVQQIFVTTNGVIYNRYFDPYVEGGKWQRWKRLLTNYDIEQIEKSSKLISVGSAPVKGTITLPTDRSYIFDLIGNNFGVVEVKYKDNDDIEKTITFSRTLIELKIMYNAGNALTIVGLNSDGTYNNTLATGTECKIITNDFYGNYTINGGL